MMIHDANTGTSALYRKPRFRLGLAREMLSSRTVFTLATTVTRTSLISNLRRSPTSKDSCDNVSYELLEFVLEDIRFDLYLMYTC